MVLDGLAAQAAVDATVGDRRSSLQGSIQNKSSGTSICF
jgi:hypothetical protein